MQRRDSGVLRDQYRRRCAWGVYSLPLSGLFLSVIFPTINSKGIRSVPKSEHGAAAGVLRFFTCLSAVLAPLSMRAISDAMGGPIYRFILATGFAALLFFGLVLNGIPTRPAKSFSSRAAAENRSGVEPLAETLCVPAWRYTLRPNVSQRLRQLLHERYESVPGTSFFRLMLPPRRLYVDCLFSCGQACPRSRHQEHSILKVLAAGKRSL